MAQYRVELEQCTGHLPEKATMISQQPSHGTTLELASLILD